MTTGHISLHVLQTSQFPYSGWRGELNLDATLWVVASACQQS